MTSPEEGADYGIPANISGWFVFLMVQGDVFLKVFKVMG